MNNRLYGNLILSCLNPDAVAIRSQRTSSDTMRCRLKCVVAKMLNCQSVTN